jgi:hypothetical protein
MLRYIGVTILTLLLASLASAAVEPIELSGKTYSDFSMFNGTKDLELGNSGGATASMMGLDEAFLADNEEDGLPINQNKPVLLVGSMVGYNRTAQALGQNWTVG